MVYNGPFIRRSLTFESICGTRAAAACVRVCFVCVYFLLYVVVVVVVVCV
jgi:hypothetical protein